MRNGQDVRDAGRYVRRMAREDGRLARAAMLHVHDFDLPHRCLRVRDAPRSVGWSTAAAAPVLPRHGQGASSMSAPYPRIGIVYEPKGAAQARRRKEKGELHIRTPAASESDRRRWHGAPPTKPRTVTRGTSPF